MDANFWHQRWENEHTGFHQATVTPWLQNYVDKLHLEPGSRVFVPLCGKTLDIGWLLAQGYRVAGVELSALAIQQLFDELGITPQITAVGDLQHYHAPNIDIFVGDFFALTHAMLGDVDAVFDRAALVALPGTMRQQYTRHLAAICGAVPQLVITYQYDQTKMHGPPFSIDDAEMGQHYDAYYTVTALERDTISDGLKRVKSAQEIVWLLQPTGS